MLFFGLQAVIPLWKELEYYKDYQKILRAHLGEKKANETISEALHIISVGTNDFLENYYAMPAGPGSRRTQFTIGEYQDFLADIAHNFVKSLYNLGARKISLGGLPPMGCMPLERTTNLMGEHQCVESYNNVALQFNGKLSGLVLKLNKELPGIKLVFSNPYFAFMQVIRRPALYGTFILSFISFLAFVTCHFLKVHVIVFTLQCFIIIMTFFHFPPTTF